MSPRRSFLRKIVYLVAIGVLLVPLFWLSQPAATGARGAKGFPGGKLAQLRAEYGLSETQLGEVDPASETIKLATLGMRGVAANILWEKANNYMKKKDWTNLAATLNQIIKLEPHFIHVWRHQAWNLSYNVSVEFDDYRERYRWLIRGIDFLQQGIRYNEREPRLVADVGWFVSHKMGRADEVKQFRELFKKDDEFHGSRPESERDNWLVGKEWFEKAEEMVDEKGVPLRGQDPLIFFSHAPMCQIYYAEALEEDGIFGEKAEEGWQYADEEWTEFGSRDFDFPGESDATIRLNDREMYTETARAMMAELEELKPGLRDDLVDEKRALLSEEELEALDTAPDQRSREQNWLAAGAAHKLQVTNLEVAKRITGANRGKALELADQANEAERMAGIIDRQRNIVNFDYWRRRARVEQTTEALAARKWIYTGDEAFRHADLPGAKEAYLAGLASWRQVLDNQRFPGLAKDANMVDELMEVINRYRRILQQREEEHELQEGFILQDVVDEYERTHAEPDEESEEEEEEEDAEA